MITKDTTAARDGSADAGTAGSRTRSCRCGQQLDVCINEHCPRCGRTLSRV